jgi:hypothetical protein
VWEGLVGGVTNVLPHERTTAGPTAPTAPRDLQGKAGDVVRLPRGEDGVELKNASGLLEDQTTPPTSTGELLGGAGGANSSPSNEVDIEEEEKDEVNQEEEEDMSTQEVVSHETEEHRLPGVGDDEKPVSTDHTNLRYEASREGGIKGEPEPAPYPPLDEGLLQALQAGADHPRRGRSSRGTQARGTSRSAKNPQQLARAPQRGDTRRSRRSKGRVILLLYASSDGLGSRTDPKQLQGEGTDMGRANERQ